MDRAEQARGTTFWRGFAAAVVGASLWGLSGASAQCLFDDYGASPSFVTAFRMVAAGALFLMVVLVRSRSLVARLLHCKRDCAALALFGIALFGSQFTFAFSVEGTNAGTACVLQMLNAVFVLAVVCVAARKLPTMREGTGLALALAATVLIATQGDLSTIRLPVEGLAWGLANALSVAVYIVVPRLTGLFDRYGSFAVTGLGMAVGSVAACAALAVQQATGGRDLLAPAASFDAAAWAVLVVGVALLGTFAAFSLYIGGVARVGSVLGSLLGAMEPLAATALSALWLGTAFSGADWLGFALMVAMLVCMTLPGKRQAEDG